MQDEAAIHLYRAAEMHLGIADFGAVCGDLKLVEQRRQSQIDRAVHHDAEGSLLVMLADIGERPRKEGVRHVRHGDQEMMREVYVVHGAAICGILYRPDCPGTNPYNGRGADNPIKEK